MKRFHDINEYSFATLVDVYKKFGVPNFQRAYKWGSKQLTDFFFATESNDKSYFIGNIVCVLGNGDNENRLIIIDGQQRLTTICLMLIALRDRAKEILPEKDHDKVTWIDDFLKDKDKRTRGDYYVLKPRKNTYYQVFTDLIDGRYNEKLVKYDKAQLVYIRAYKILKELITGKIGDDLEKLHELIDKVLELQVVAIILDSEKEVFDAFEGLNSKGLGLSVSDQIKNQLFGHAEKLGCLDDVEQIWDEMELDFEKVAPDLITKFLRHVWIAENKYVSVKDLYESLKKEIQKNRNKGDLVAYCQQLRDYSKFYLAIFSKQFSHYFDGLDTTVRDALVDYQIIDNQQVYEILVALYIKHKKDKEFKPGQFRDIVNLLWNFCLRAKFSILSPSVYEKHFANYCRIVRETPGCDVKNKSKDFIDTLKNLTKDRESFIDCFVSDLSYTSDSKLTEFLFKKVIEAKDGGKITFKKTSIEHILPQDPKKWNLRKSEIKDYVHLIGNLTLLHPDDNQNASDWPLEKKCTEVYKNSHFKFNKEIESKYKDIFNIDWRLAIEQRGRDIAGEIYTLTKI
ncbi:MAG: DUF262 domain-containing protein [Candidatus Taylorbacteria bacterium]|nr:DUF262 domain-containing protein [Candidatus Taylorbacteria bacterium]